MIVVLSLGLMFGCLFLVALPIALLVTANRSSTEPESLGDRKLTRGPAIRLEPSPRVLPEKNFAASIRAVVAAQTRAAPSDEQVARLMRPTLYCYEFQPLRIARIMMRENHLQSLPVVDLTKRFVGTITMHDIAARQQSWPTRLPELLGPGR